MKMAMAVTKFYFTLLCLIGISIHTNGREMIYTEDGFYEVMNISIPRKVWREAIHPTSVLKSPVTMVVPVYVPSDDENELDDNAQEQDAVIEAVSPVVNVTNEEIVEATTSTIPAQDQPINPDPISPDDEAPVDTSVAGQVIRFPCSCPSGQCGCCTGAILQRINMKACGNISFIPEDFVFDVRLTVNNNTVVRQRVSASDPPPICFNPRRAPFVRVCAEISNIRIRNRNAYACMDINADIGGFPVYSASFRCFGLGSKGVQTGLKPKPVSSGPEPISLFGNGDDDDDRGSFLENAAGTILGGGDDGGPFGGGGGLFGDGDDDGDGPLDAIGDAVGGIFEE